jgi:hypothetical protein
MSDAPAADAVVGSSSNSPAVSPNPTKIDKNKLPDSDGYTAHLEEARNHTNLNPIRFSECVQVFQDSNDQPVIVFIPKLALDKCRHEPEDDIVRRVLLYFILTVDEVVKGPYTLVYCHTAVNILSQTALLSEYYRILPRRYKKNLQVLAVIHPTFSIKMFFEFTRMLVSAKFYSKLRYVEDVHALQQLYPGRGWQLPPLFLYWEDLLLKGLNEHRADNSSHVSRYVLEREFLPELGAPSLVHRCVEHIRRITRVAPPGSGPGTGMAKDGLFRISGDQTVRSLVRLRLQHCSCDEGKQFPANNHCIVIGGGEGETGSADCSPPPGSGAALLSTVVISDIDAVAGALKLAVGEGLRPLVVYEAYSELVRLTKEILHPSTMVLPGGASSSQGLGGPPGPLPTPPGADSGPGSGANTPPPAALDDVTPASYARYGEWRAAVQSLFDQHMPPAHTSTLTYLCK